MTLSTLRHAVSSCEGALGQKPGRGTLEVAEAGGAQRPLPPRRSGGPDSTIGARVHPFLGDKVCLWFDHVPSEHELWGMLDDLRELKRCDKAHGNMYRTPLAEKIAKVWNALRGFHHRKVLNDPIDE